MTRLLFAGWLRRSLLTDKGRTEDYGDFRFWAKAKANRVLGDAETARRHALRALARKVVYGPCTAPELARFCRLASK